MAYVEYNKQMPYIEISPDIFNKIRAIFIKAEKVSVLCKYEKRKNVYRITDFAVPPQATGMYNIIHEHGLKLVDSGFHCLIRGGGTTAASIKKDDLKWFTQPMSGLDEFIGIQMDKAGNVDTFISSGDYTFRDVVLYISRPVSKKDLEFAENILHSDAITEWKYADGYEPNTHVVYVQPDILKCGLHISDIVGEE